MDLMDYVKKPWSSFWAVNETIFLIDKMRIDFDKNTDRGFSLSLSLSLVCVCVCSALLFKESERKQN